MRAISSSTRPRPRLPASTPTFRLRPPTLDDAEAVASLLAARNRVDFGETEYFDFAAEELREWWRVDVAGDEIAGAGLGFGERHLGWILDLAVSPRHRRRGLGVALLQSTFRAFVGREVTRIGLEVDAENETGATRLYERAGMRVTRRYATYEKPLAGRRLKTAVQGRPS